jgi:small subunit ribosomal protein S2
MAPYISGYKNNVHLIDVSKTAFQLEKAAQFLESIAAEGKTILWVGTKKPAQAIVQALAGKLDMPFVNHRWVGGTLSNRPQVRKSVTKLLHYQDVLSKSEQFPLYTKKEFNVIQKASQRLEKNVGGIKNLHWPLGALVVVDVTKERSAIKEAASVGVPVVAIVDTNGDPSMVNYVIPGNDDAPRAIKVVLDFLAEAVEKGKETAKAQGKEKVVADEVMPAVDEQVALVLAQAEEEVKAEEKSKGKTVGEDAPKRRSPKKN